MRQGLKRLCTLGLLGLPLAVTLPAVAQQPVVRDLSAGDSTFYDQAATREEAGGSLVLFNRVQRNQEELRRLRGQVEELRYQLEQLRKQTRQQYMDIEDRLSTAGGSASAPSSQAPSSSSASSEGDSAASDPSSAPDQGASGGDSAGREAYQAAFAKVQARDFGAAKQAFQSFIDDYPQSGLTANAYYWLGELHSAESELDAAADAFNRVIESYPDSNKVPDALYKLGLLKARQGDPEASRELLERVQNDYPDSSAANLADDFLRQSGN